MSATPRASLAPWILLVAAAGCGGAPYEPAARGKETSPRATGTAGRAAAPGRIPLTFTDALGREVTIDSPPRRIISLAPKNTELLFAVGAQGELVGTTTYCNDPPAAADVARVGGFTSESISIERLISLRPELVLAVGELHRVVITELDSLGIPVVALAAESLAELYSEIDLLGRITGRESNAARLIESMQTRVAGVQEAVRGIPPQERPSVYYQIWDEPLSAAGPGSYIGELIEIAGGRNIISDVSTPYLMISEEIVLERNPEVIIAPAMASKPVSLERFLKKRAWSEVRAVRNGRVHLLDGDLVSRCGPRLVDALEILVRLLYPDRFEAGARERDSAERPGEAS